MNEIHTYCHVTYSIIFVALLPCISPLPRTHWIVKCPLDAHLGERSRSSRYFLLTSYIMNTMNEYTVFRM